MLSLHCSTAKKGLLIKSYCPQFLRFQTFVTYCCGSLRQRFAHLSSSYAICAMMPEADPGRHALFCLQYHPDEGAKSFYEEAAVGATAVGACIDLFAISPFSCGLSILEPLAARTGGILYLYPQLEAASLPQVIHKNCFWWIVCS